MKLIEEIVEKLLGILMVMASELSILSRNNLQYFDRLQCFSVCCEVILNKFTISTCQISRTPQHIGDIKLLHIIIRNKELIQCINSKHTLQRSIHITSIPQILQPNLTSSLDIIKLVYSFVDPIYLN